MRWFRMRVTLAVCVMSGRYLRLAFVESPGSN